MRSTTSKILYFLFILLITATGVLYSKTAKTRDEETQKIIDQAETKAPYINSIDLPKGSVGQHYSASIFATLYAHADLQVSAQGLPKGLIIEECSNEKDSKLAPLAPNTVAKCNLTGVPVTPGKYTIRLDAYSTKSRTNTVSDMELIIEGGS